MKENIIHEIIDSKSDKRKELEFWANMLIKELERMNNLLDEVIIRCEQDKGE